MSRPHPHAQEIRSLDTAVGDDGDAPGIAQEITSDDIDDIAFTPDLPVEERLARLEAMRDELRTRAAGDFGEDMREALGLVRDRIRLLKAPVEGAASLQASGMDTDTRGDDDDPAERAAERDEE